MNDARSASVVAPVDPFSPSARGRVDNRASLRGGPCSVVLALFGDGRFRHSALCSCSFFGSRTFSATCGLELHATGGPFCILERSYRRAGALAGAAEVGLPAGAAVPGPAELRAQLPGGGAVPEGRGVRLPPVPGGGALPGVPDRGVGLGGGGRHRGRQLGDSGSARSGVGLGSESGWTEPQEPWLSLVTTRGRCA